MKLMFYFISLILPLSNTVSVFEIASNKKQIVVQIMSDAPVAGIY